MPPTPASSALFGWVRLLNGAADSGYVYMTSSPEVPRLGSTGYIVTSMPPDRIEFMLSVIGNEGKMQIRYFDPQVAGRDPSVFIEPRNLTAAAAQSELFLPLDVAEDVARLSQ